MHANLNQGWDWKVLTQWGKKKNYNKWILGPLIRWLLSNPTGKKKNFPIPSLWLVWATWTSQSSHNQVFLSKLRLKYQRYGSEQWTPHIPKGPQIKLVHVLSQTTEFLGSFGAVPSWKLPACSVYVELSFAWGSTFVENYWYLLAIAV